MLTDVQAFHCQIHSLQRAKMNDKI